MHKLKRSLSPFCSLVIFLLACNPQVPAQEMDSWNISSETGEAIETVQFDSPSKQIIFIQDAHDSFDAQIHIAQIIQHLVSGSGVRTVFEEGYEGPVPTEKYFGSYSPAIKKRMGYFFMDALRLGGAEYAHLLDSSSFKLIGVDSIPLLLQHQHLYQIMTEESQRMQADLHRARMLFQDAIKRRANTHLKQGIFLRTQKDTDKISWQNYGARLWTLKCASSSARCGERYPAIAAVFQKGTHQAFSAGKYLEEFQKLEQDFFEESAPTAIEKKMVRWMEWFRQADQMVRLQITSEDYARFRQETPLGKTRELAEFIALLRGQDIVLSSAWEDSFQKALQFYDLVQRRDDLLREHLKKWKENPSEEKAVLVYGGFHSSSIIRMLKDLKISYTVIRPKMNEMNDRHQKRYRDLMGNPDDPLQIALGFSKAARGPGLYVFARNREEEVPLILQAAELRAWEGQWTVEQEEAGFAEMRAELRTSRVTEPAPRPRRKGKVSALAVQAIAHDIRNLIAIFTGSAEVLSSGSQADLQISKWLSYVLTATADLNFLAEELSGLAKQAKNHKERLDLRIPIQKAVHLMQLDFPYPITVEPGDPVFVTGNAESLTLAFINVIKNAKKAILDKALSLKDAGENGISLKLQTSEKTVRVIVADTGIGIRPENMKRIFGTGWTTKKGDDHGLGLLRVQNTFTAEHNGKISVKSKYGEGTSIFIVLPLAPDLVGNLSSHLNAAMPVEEREGVLHAELREYLPSSKALPAALAFKRPWRRTSPTKPFTFVTPVNDVMQLTPEQFSADIIKMALGSDQTRFIFYKSQRALSGPYAEELVQLKMRLGPRIQISSKNLSELRISPAGSWIHLAKKDPGNSEFQKSRHRFVRFEYEGDEIGVPAAALLYVESGIANPFQRVMHLSTVDVSIRDAAKASLEQLILARSA